MYRLLHCTPDYHDAHMLTDLVGKKIVPVLVNDEGKASTESGDIIAFLFQLKGITQKAIPQQLPLDWQAHALPLLQRIAYPRWPELALREFASAESRRAWQEKKQTDALNFARLLQQTPEIVKRINILPSETHAVLPVQCMHQALPYIDQAIYFSILNGLCCE